jgi:hypothetical protein
MKIERPDPVAWKLFAMLDEEADALGATMGDVLGAASIIVATYVLRMRAELRTRGLRNALTLGDEAAWRIFQERTKAFLDDDDKGETLH